MVLALLGSALTMLPALATDAELYGVTGLLPQFDVFDSLQQEVGNLPPVAMDPVVTSVGEFIWEGIDRDLGGPMRFGFARYHATFVRQAALFWGFTAVPLGNNWTHNYAFSIRRVSSTSVVIHYKKGKVLLFEKVAGVWQFSPSLNGVLTYRGTPYQMIEVGSKLEVMDPENRRILSFEFSSLVDGEVRGVESIRDRNGNTHTLTYNLDGTLAFVDDGLGRSLTFQYVQSNGPRISRVIDQSGRAVDYGYTNGLLTSVTDANGGTTLYTYDGAGRVLSITEPSGNVVLQNTYQFNGRVKTQTDGQGNVVTFNYGPSTTTIVDPLGNRRIHRFDSELRMTHFTDEAGNSVQYTYDGSHRLIATTDRLGGVSTIGYHEPSGYVQSRTDNLGQTWTYTYEAQVQEGFTFYELVRIDRPDGTAVTLARDARGNLLSSTDAAGNTTTYTRNVRGQADSVTNAAAGVTLFTHNADGTLATRQDPSGHVTRFDYDAMKRLVRIHRPDVSIVSLTYDGNDNVLSITNENGNVRSATYDPNDNLLSITDPLGNVTSFAYDANDDPVQMTDRLGQTTSVTYDAMRRVASRTNRDGQTVSFLYDARRRMVQFKDELSQLWSFSYDDEAVLTGLVDPLGNSWSVESDAQGRLTKITDPLSNETRYAYDALSRLVSVTDPLDRATSFLRDANGLVSQVSLADPSISASYARNALKQTTGITDPRGNVWQSLFDPQGRRTSKTDPLGNQHGYAHDNRNRVIQETLPGGLGTLDLTYDFADRLTQRSYSDGTVFPYLYDAADRLTTTTGVALSYGPRGEIATCNGLSMTHDAEGRLSSITFAPGKTVTYAYDARGQLQTITDWAGGITSFAHDASGRLSQITHPNGVASSFEYDAADRFTQVRETRLGNDLSKITLQRDGDGQITQAERVVPLPVGPEASSGPQAYDAANQVAGEAYDALGRLVHDGTWTFTWDLADRLQSYSDGAISVSFTRDAFGNVLSRTEGANSQDFVWNYALGLPSIAVEKEGGTPLRYYVHTPGGRLLYSIAAADDSRLVYHYDEMGSTLFLTSGTGQIVQRYAYSPYGEIVAESAGAGTAAADNWFTYHGAYGVMREQPVGSAHLMYSMRARYYDPVRGRFLSRDPLELTDPMSLNPYQAFFQNPLRFVDPLGTDPEDSLEGMSQIELEAELAVIEREWRDIDKELDRLREESESYSEYRIPRALQTLWSWYIAPDKETIQRIRDLGARKRALWEEAARIRQEISRRRRIAAAPIDPDGAGLLGGTLTPGTRRRTSEATSLGAPPASVAPFGSSGATGLSGARKASRAGVMEAVRRLVDRLADEAPDDSHRPVRLRDATKDPDLMRRSFQQPRVF